MQVHRSPPGGEVIVGHLQEMLDVGRIAADEVSRQLIDMGRDLGIPVFLRVALTPTVYALIGVHPDEAEVLAPTRTGQKGSYVRYLHRVLPRG